MEKADKHPVLANIEPIATFIGIDYMAISDYIENFAEEDGLPTVRSVNSPLYKYSNFLIDYENLYGSGRVREVK